MKLIHYQFMTEHNLMLLWLGVIVTSVPFVTPTIKERKGTSIRK